LPIDVFIVFSLTSLVNSLSNMAKTTISDMPQMVKHE
jgi:hypothetical protein